MKTGICKLCLQEEALLNQSHIIPDFFYKQAGLFNEKHKIQKITVPNFIVDRKTSYVPTGIYEKQILCEKCDNIVIGQLENYGRKVIFGGLSSEESVRCNNFRNPNSGYEYTIVKNVDYKRFKLFLLSMLWRAAISTNPFFLDVKLEKEQIETLRLMILNGNPGEETEFPIITASFLRDKAVPTDFVGQPMISQTEDFTLITFPLTAFVFSYLIDGSLPELEIGKYIPNKKNEFGIMHLPKGEGWNFILKYANISS